MFEIIVYELDFMFENDSNNVCCCIICVMWQLLGWISV
jgi:hypothetical protein